MRAKRAAVGALVLALLVAGWWGWGRRIARPPMGDLRWEPVVLPADYADRLVVWDYPWPHSHPGSPPDRFDGRPAVTYEDRMRAALSAFAQRYPRIQVEYRWLDFEAGPAEVEAAAASGGADVVAVFWHGPALAGERRLPLSRYLGEEVRAAVHPAAWRLAGAPGEIWAVPRWVAFHPWLSRSLPAGPGGEAPVGEMAVELARRLAAAAGKEPAFATLDSFPWLLGELMAGLPPEAWPAAAGRLEEVLDALRRAAPAGPALRAALVGGRFQVAGGVGPGLALRLWELHAGTGGLRLMRPPRLDPAQPEGIPLSLGGYAVLRGPHTTRAHAQAAVELALHLAAWEPEEAAARVLALPAWRHRMDAWEALSPLPPGERQRLREELERAADPGRPLRAYPAYGPLSPAHPQHPALRRAWARFWQGEAPTEVVEVLAGTPSR